MQVVVLHFTSHPLTYFCSGNPIPLAEHRLSQSLELISLSPRKVLWQPIWNLLAARALDISSKDGEMAHCAINPVNLEKLRYRYAPQLPKFYLFLNTRVVSLLDDNDRHSGSYTRGEDMFLCHGHPYTPPMWRTRVQIAP